MSTYRFPQSFVGKAGSVVCGSDSQVAMDTTRGDTVARRHFGDIIRSSGPPEVILPLVRDAIDGDCGAGRLRLFEPQHPEITRTDHIRSSDNTLAQLTKSLARKIKTNAQNIR